MTILGRTTITFGLVFVATLACAGDGTGPGGNGGNNGGGNGGGTPTLSATIQPILTMNCALSGCHAGSQPAQGMNLSTGQTFSNTVNVGSNQLPSMDRIEPGQPDLSYLVHKIQGTQAGVGGSGNRMPLGGQLTQSQIDLIRAWIAAGANDN